MASNRCPNCRKHFQTLADEVGTHYCPHCGESPAGRIAEEEREEEPYEKHWRDE